jgi:hypothetical protein
MRTATALCALALFCPFCLAADAPRPEKPKSPEATAATARANKAVADAEAVYRAAVVKARQQELEGLKAAQARALKAGPAGLDEANRIGAQVTRAQAEVDASRPAAAATRASGRSLSVIVATWGEGGRNADVTKAVADRLARREDLWANNDLTDGQDPSPGKVKRLTIKLSAGGMPLTVVVPDGLYVSIQPGDTGEAGAGGAP